MTEPTTAEVLRNGAAVALLIGCAMFFAPLEAIVFYSALNPPFATGAFQLILIVLAVAGLPAWFLCLPRERSKLFGKVLLYSTGVSILTLVVLCGRLQVSYGAASVPFVILLLQLAASILLAKDTARQ